MRLKERGETKSPAVSNVIKACLCLSVDEQKRNMMRYFMKKSLYNRLKGKNNKKIPKFGAYGMKEQIATDKKKNGKKIWFRSKSMPCYVEM